MMKTDLLEPTASVASGAAVTVELNGATAGVHGATARALGQPPGHLGHLGQQGKAKAMMKELFSGHTRLNSEYSARMLRD